MLRSAFSKIVRVPAGIWCHNDVGSKSMRRHHVASTLIRRHFGTKCPLGCDWIKYKSGKSRLVDCVFIFFHNLSLLSPQTLLPAGIVLCNILILKFSYKLLQKSFIIEIKMLIVFIQRVDNIFIVRWTTGYCSLHFFALQLFI